MIRHLQPPFTRSAAANPRRPAATEAVCGEVSTRVRAGLTDSTQFLDSGLYLCFEIPSLIVPY